VHADARSHVCCQGGLKPPGLRHTGDVLVIQELSKRYGNNQANDRVSLRVPRRRIVGFVGPNGAGKSTAMRAIMGLVRPDSGSIEWDGQPLHKVGVTHIGYMPEQRGLYPKMKILDQVRYFGDLKGGVAPAEIRSRATSLLTELGLGERLDDPVEKLSHGNQQRVQLAVALVNNPELLVLDEPFGGLDPVAASRLEAILRDHVEQGAGVLFSSHQLELVERICDDVVIIADGRIRASGEVRQVRADFGRYRVRVRVDEPQVPLVECLTAFAAEEAGAHQVVVYADSDQDIERVLAQARKAGPITEFHYELPTLAELFGDLTAHEEQS